MKPKSASDVLRQLSPRKVIGTSFFTGNRFSSLRDQSPALSSRARSQSSVRDRSVSSKRKPEDDTSWSYAAITGNNPRSGQSTLEAAGNLNTKLAGVRSLVDLAAKQLSEESTDPKLIPILGCILEALTSSCDLQADIINCISSGGPKPPTSNTVNMTSLGATSKRLRQDMVSSRAGAGSGYGAASSAPPPTGKQGGDSYDADPIMSNFRDAVRTAERSTLVFNLNLGKVPIMNQNTISTKATSALTTMAASKEGKFSCVPSEEAVAAIDDVLSVVKSMQFYGKSTRTYRNPKDPKSGSYCTIPVRYEFKDKDTRIRAETSLREHCGINSSTPYPTILRETIRQVIAHVKSDYPDNQVKVNVDVKNFGLKVSRRPPANKESRVKPVWKDFDRLIPLPKEVLDTSARTIPENFKVAGLPTPSENVDNNINMDTDSQHSNRLSRINSHNAATGGSPGKK